jgi:hypothetical protein
MDAVKCIKEKARMCGINCPINFFTECVGCDSWIEQHPEEAVRIIEEWSKANPLQTNNNKFKEVFGIDFRKLMFDTSANRTLWLNKPYELPKADSEKNANECEAHLVQTNTDKFKEVFG